MDIAIMQPTYLPWVGYFDLINLSDNFVFLENVKFEKSSWQTRNKIPINNKSSFLTVPVRGSRNQIIFEVLINEESNWRKKHISTLNTVYKNHPFGTWMLGIILPIINDLSITKLSELNIKLIKTISKEIKIYSNFKLGSKIKTKGTKSTRLLEICHHFKAKKYYSPIGSKDYIQKENLIVENNIEVIYQKLKLVEYKQFRSNNFISQLSIIDLMANLGPENSKKYIDDLSYDK